MKRIISLFSRFGTNLLSLFRKPAYKSEVTARFPYLNQNDREHMKSLAIKLLRRSGGEVFYGPLSGMKIPETCFLATRPIWIVGCYEQELEQTFSDIISNPPEQIIDIGSAYGYYMVGLALQTKTTILIGFEADADTHWREAEALAVLNGVSDRIIQKGCCTIQSLREVLKNACVVISDCEGAEVDLLDPSQIPALKTCQIICEMHDFYIKGATSILIDRFKASHKIRVIHESKRDPFQFRILDGLSDTDKFLAVRETKHIQGRLTSSRFLVMTPFS